MKRTVTAMITGMVIAVLLSSCRSNPVAEPPVDSFSCTAEMITEAVTATAQLTRTGAGTMRLAFSAPPSLDGVVLCWEGETVTVTNGTVSTEIRADAVPVTAMGNLLMQAFDAALRGETATQITGTAVRHEGNTDGMDYVLQTDASTGFPIGLSVPSVPLTVRFSAVELP